MSEAMYMSKEERQEIPSPKESWRKMEMELVASDYEILWCLQKSVTAGESIIANDNESAGVDNRY